MFKWVTEILMIMLDTGGVVVWAAGMDDKNYLLGLRWLSGVALPHSAQADWAQRKAIAEDWSIWSQTSHQGLYWKWYFFFEQEDTVVMKIMYAACGL